MNYLKFSLGIFLVLAASRFVPHPPNFTSLLALGFYIPLFFGRKFIFAVLLSFVVTDLIIGFHSSIFFTWSSIVLIGLISKFFTKNMIISIVGALSGAIIFFIITNFGVWTSGVYGYTVEGLLASYIMAIPFFSYSFISTIIYSVIIEAIYHYKKRFTSF